LLLCNKHGYKFFFLQQPTLECLYIFLIQKILLS
jgi:hypothetical protein